MAADRVRAGLPQYVRHCTIWHSPQGWPQETTGLRIQVGQQGVSPAKQGISWSLLPPGIQAHNMHICVPSICSSTCFLQGCERQ